MKFEELKLSDKTVKSIHNYGYVEATEVQQKAIPKIIAGTNLIVRSQTGTGKTAAFGIGLIERIAVGTTRKSLILAPTRELAMQVCKELRGLSQIHQLKVHVVYGGQSINLQIRDLKGGYHILVATPGRLLDLYRRGNVDIAEFDSVVLDEADHMLDLGFQEDVFMILGKLPAKKLILLFSATVDESIKSIASRYMPNSEIITLGEISVVSTIKEEHVEATKREKFPRFIDALNAHPNMKILVFMKTKRGVAWLKDRLEQRGYKGVDMLQGDMSQSSRTRVIEKFKSNAISILIATNVAARGLHIDDVGLIVNYDEAENEETHLHRVGRTGRMGAEGKVINFIQRTESVHERMAEDHPDFAWMKEGSGPGYGSGPRRQRGERQHRPYGRHESGGSHHGRHGGSRGAGYGHDSSGAHHGRYGAGHSAGHGRDESSGSHSESHGSRRPSHGSRPQHRHHSGRSRNPHR